MVKIEGEDDLRPRFNTADTQTNITGSGNPVIVVNQDKKKKPYDVKFGKNEPKIKPNMKYSSKQSYRRYKSKTEPNLNSNIMVNEEDDIVKQIKKAFGITPENTNYSSVESAPIDPNYFNFQTPAEFAPFQNGYGDHIPDDKFLFKFTIQHAFQNEVEIHNFGEHFKELQGQNPSIKNDFESLNRVLQDYLITNNKISFRTEQIPRLKLIDSLTDKKAKQIYDKMSDDDKTHLDLYLEDTLNSNHALKRDVEFKKMIKEELLNKLKQEDEFDDMFKEDEEALLGMKVPKTEIQEEALIGPKILVAKEDLLNFFDVEEEPPSPVHTPTPTELSAKTTEPYGSSIGELTSAELKRPVGRPATKPETIAKKQYEQALKSFKLTKKKNVDKHFNQPVKMEYNLEFYKSFNY